MMPQNALSAIAAFPTLGGQNQLAALQSMLARAGVPTNLPCCHVAGTNGKGSVCAFTERVLRASGYTTGLFTSPYLVHFTERIRVNGRPISLRLLARHTEKLLPLAKGQNLSQFGFITAIAFSVFSECKPDIVIWETGLGGRLDPTNICSPLTVAITPIGLDHTALLGGTLAEIAAQKAGIIKPGVQTVLACQPLEAKQVLLAAAKTAGAPVTEVKKQDIQNVQTGLWGTKFAYQNQAFTLALPGAHQAENAAVAIALCRAVAAPGTLRLREGLRLTRWPARLQWAGQNPDICIDGAHNPPGALRLAEFAKTALPNRRIVLLCAMAADKDCSGVLEILRPLAQAAVFCPAPTPRSVSPEVLVKLWNGSGKASQPCETTQTPQEGLQRAIAMAGPGGVVLAAGSLYLAGALLALLAENKTANNRTNR